MSPSNRLVILVRSTSFDDAANEDGAASEPSDRDLIVRPATAEDASAHARDLSTYPPEAFRQRLTPQNRCYLAIRNDRVLHSSWCTVSPAWTEELQTYLAPPPGDSYVYESLTRADARGQGIYPIVLRSIAEYLHEEGMKRVWIGVEEANTSSIRAIRKAGFEEDFSVTYRVRDGRVECDVGRRLDPWESLHIVTDPDHMTR